MRWSPDLAARVESQAYEKSRGVKVNRSVEENLDYSIYLFRLSMADLFKCIFNKFKVTVSSLVSKSNLFVLAALQNRNNQQQQQQQTAINNTMTFSNPPQQQVQPQQSIPVSVMNPMVTQTPRFPSSQPTPRMANPIGTIVNPTPSLREPPKFNPSKSLLNHISPIFLCSLQHRQEQ